MTTTNALLTLPRCERILGRHARIAARNLAAVAMLLASCHGEPARHPGQEYVAGVKFEGNSQLTDKQLLDGLMLHRLETGGRSVDPYQVKNDADRLRSKYRREGFFGVDVQPRIERENDAVTVAFKIQEGSRARVIVKIVGLPHDEQLLTEKVRRAMPLADGMPFDYQRYDDAKVTMLGVVRDAGYAHAKLDATVRGDLPSQTATIVLAFTPGPKCRFGEVTVQGVDGQLREAVLNRLHFAPGDTYSIAAITATQRDLYGMSRFSSVQVGMASNVGDTDEVVDMTIAVSESAAHQITLGGGIGIDPISYEARARTGYQIVGWPFQLDTVTLDFRPAYAYLRDGTGFEPRIRVLAKLERQDLFFTHAKGSIEAGFTYLAYEAFTEYGPEAQLGYEIPLGTPHVLFRLGYLVQRYDFLRPSPLLGDALATRLRIDRPELLGAYTQVLVVDFRDHPIEPRWGLYGEVKLSEGGRYAAGEYQYEQITPEIRAYAPLGPVELAARARFGAIYGDVPPTERFYAGGATSNRGFAERMLSPSVTGEVNGSTVTVPYGGAAMFDTSVEARIPLVRIKKMPLHGVVFLDGGDVTETVAELDPSHLNWALGLGLRLLTIVGPIRLDFGYRLNRTGPADPEPGSTWAFHLSLGEAF